MLRPVLLCKTSQELMIILCNSCSSKACSKLHTGTVPDYSGICHLMLCLHGGGWTRTEEEYLNYWHCVPFCAESYSSFVLCKGITREYTLVAQTQTSTASRTTGIHTSINLKKTLSVKGSVFSSDKHYFQLK